MSATGSRDFGKNSPDETDIHQLIRVTKLLEQAFQKCSGTVDKLTKSQYVALLKLVADHMKLEKMIIEQKRKEYNQLVRDNRLFDQRKTLQDNEHTARRLNTAQIINDRKQARIHATMERIEKAKDRADNARSKIVLEELHSMHVRQHIAMRNALKGSTDKLNFFTKSLTKGLSVGGLIGVASGGVHSFWKQKQMISGLQKDKTDLELKKAGMIFGGASSQSNEILALTRAIDDLTNRIEDETKKKEQSLTGQVLGNRGESALDKMGAFATKHANGLILGAAAGGLMVWALKKALDASPIFNQIWKLLDFGINLLLRPIGDFFGFLLRPIVVMLLRYFIIPFYRSAYPFFRDWGTSIGEGIAELIGDGGWLSIIAMGVISLVALWSGAKLVGKLVGGIGGIIAQLFGFGQKGGWGGLGKSGGGTTGAGGTGGTGGTGGASGGGVIGRILGKLFPFFTDGGTTPTPNKDKNCC